MPRKKTTTIEQSELEKQKQRRSDCREAIAKCLRTSTAYIVQLDELGYTQTEINQGLTRYMHTGGSR